jgi:hypothetical protein
LTKPLLASLLARRQPIQRGGIQTVPLYKFAQCGLKLNKTQQKLCYNISNRCLTHGTLTSALGENAPTGLIT